ncbi:hypothetical protein [Psychrobacter proteolyticus]|uniref:hypothetical protein n=1 Tax=Psychrobacter proteolyticus TaxID=147825 RepID=UPI0013B358A4|nr:hypothetical protein [Psychrobacter proteolyticus]
MADINPLSIRLIQSSDSDEYPFTGEETAIFKSASLNDLNDAYVALEKAQQA